MKSGFVALLGRPNAGKSTLFNALVKARTYAADQLFATLDTTTRQLYLEDVGRSVSLSDTVGFIRDLPHKLVEAFEATLQEAADADLLLHVVDASSSLLAEQMTEVQRVLTDIGADGIPQVLVYNKVDRLALSQRPRSTVDALEVEAGTRYPRVFASALNGDGLDELRKIIGHAAQGEPSDRTPDEEPSALLDHSGAKGPDPQARHTGTTHLHSSR